MYAHFCSTYDNFTLKSSPNWHRNKINMVNVHWKIITSASKQTGTHTKCIRVYIYIHILDGYI